MEPTFFDGDIVLTTALNSKLQKGDVVILKDPFRPEQKICKRVVGTMTMLHLPSQGLYFKFKPWLSK